MEVKIKEIKIDFSRPENSADHIQARVDIFSDNGIYLGEQLINGNRGKIGVSFDDTVRDSIKSAVEKIKEKISEEIIGIKKTNAEPIK